MKITSVQGIATMKIRAWERGRPARRNLPLGLNARETRALPGPRPSGRGTAIGGSASSIFIEAPPMLASTFVYSGLVIAVAGLVLVVRPIRRLRVRTRRRGVAIVGVGLVMVAIALIFPTSESRIIRVESRLDEFAPVWQFREFHTINIAAPPARVFEAIKRVRADEIFLFRTLIWIRTGGQPPPKTIFEAAKRNESLIDVATNSTFVYLADDAPREFVVGTVVARPPGARGKITPEIFQKPLPPGFALATMNFIVKPDGANGSIVSTETRVFANSPAARRRFAAYWRVIYPGSAIIRRSWLRAVERRARARGKG